MSACVGPRPPVSPLSSAMASSSAVTRQPAFFSCARSASKAARSSFFSAASRSSTSGMKGAPGSVAVFSTSPSSGSRISSAASMAAAIRFSASVSMVAVHRAPSSMRGARPSSMSLKSMPCGGRAMRTRRPSRFQRQAQSRAAASPGSSPSASTITSRTSRGRSRARRPGGRKRRPGRMAGRLHGGEAGLDAFADHQHVAGLGEAHRAATARAEHHLRGSTGALPPPSRARKVRWMASGVAVRAVRHQRHHRRPDAARGMFQPGMEAERRRRWKMQAARDEIGLDQRADRRRASRQMPNARGVRAPSSLFGLLVARAP